MFHWTNRSCVQNAFFGASFGSLAGNIDDAILGEVPLETQTAISPELLGPTRQKKQRDELLLQ